MQGQTPAWPLSLDTSQHQWPEASLAPASTCPQLGTAGPRTGTQHAVEEVCWDPAHALWPRGVPSAPEPWFSPPQGGTDGGGRSRRGGET